MPGPASSQADWWRSGVVYQVYPRSFADANGDGIGDLAGIEAHLDHLAGAPESLGIDAIWLSPFYPSPDFDFGYDVSDYVGVDPRYGTLADFDRLVEACHRRGVKVVLDLVLNHSSHLHPWFQASRERRDGPYADWYIWADSPGRTRAGRRRPPNNWRSWFGGSAWTWDEGRGQFYMHTFLPEQPDLNWRHPPARAALLDVVRTWLDRGVDGFRLDVFNVFLKDAAMRSNPRREGRTAWERQVHAYDRDQPELADLLAEIRTIVDGRPGRMTVGELFDGTLDAAVRLTGAGHLAFDFSLVLLPWSATAFRDAMARRDAAFGEATWPTVVLSNHDQPRHASRFETGDGAVATAEGELRAKVAATFLLTSRGSPYLYYGEEVALRNLSIPNRLAFDPPARRRNFAWWNRDQARGPMPWSGGPGGGFTTGEAWLPLPPDVASRNVEAQAADPASVLSYYRRLLALRAATPALRVGTQQLLDVGDDDVLAYRRTGTEGSAIVVCNFAPRAAPVILPGAAPGRAWRLALSSHSRAAGDLGGPITLAALEALVAVDQ